MKTTNISILPKLILFSPFIKRSPNPTISSDSYHHQYFTVPSHVLNPSQKKDPLTFATALIFSSNTKNSLLGTQTHAQIIKTGFPNDTFSQNNLLWMYCRCHLLPHALTLFDEMTERNLVSWTSMISGLIQNNECELGLDLYPEMTRSGFRPNEFTLATVLSACAHLGARKVGSLIHCVGLKIGMDGNPFVSSSLICMYAKCGSIEAAEVVFGLIDRRDLTCWNAMVECYALYGYGYDAMRTVALMHSKGILADQFTFVSALKGCLITKDVNFGQQIHSLVIYYGFESCTEVMNSLVDMYFTMDLKDSAMDVFCRIKGKDNVSWNIVINGSAREEDEERAVALFLKMLRRGVKPNQATFSILLRLCGAEDNFSLGLQFFCLSYRLGFFDDIHVVNSLINMFAKCGMVDKSYFLFHGLQTRSIVTWNEMISGYSLNGFNTDALHLFSTLVEFGIKADEFTYPSVLGVCDGPQHQKIGEQIHANIVKSGFSSCCYVGSSLINAYMRFGLVSNSFKIFQDVGVLDIVTWGAMMSAFSKQGLSCEALFLLNCLRRQDKSPDDFILGSALNACANSAALYQCKGIHSHVIKVGYEEHLCIASAIVDAYAKSGDIISSKKAFDSMSRYDDAIVFNAMITAYAHHGLTKEAIELFERMELVNLNPTQATFVAVISACSHLGLVEKGQCFFNSMSSDYRMHPSKDNFVCLVDLFARNGHLEKARDVIESMPYEPWPAIWRCLLSGCRIHGDKEMGKLAADRILELAPSSDGAYVLLSNVYAGDGRWEDAEKVRVIMEERHVQKVPGCSVVGV